MKWEFDTQAIHHDRDLEIETGAISQPIVPAVAYYFNDVDVAKDIVSGEREGIYYGRYGNPTLRVLEKKIAALEGSEDALGVSSGMAAISIALLTYLKQGDHVVVTKDVYGGTHKFLSNLAPRYGIEHDYVDCVNLKEIEKSIKGNTRAVYIETPSNPSLTLIDIKAVSKITRKYNIPLIVDNTFMTSYLQRPLEQGADVVVYSATKYINGHGDVIAGLICGRKKDIDYMRKDIMGDLGQSLSSWESYLILRGLKTLSIRIDRHCENALRVAEFLELSPLVKKVYYPGLKSHPQYILAKQQMKGMGGIVSFEIIGGVENSKTFLNSLKLAMISFSLGDPETLVQHPASMTHSSIPEDELADFGIEKGLIRLSLGLESSKDIISDLEQALSSIMVPV